MIGSFRGTLMTLTSRNYVMGGLGAVVLLAFLSVMLNVGEAEETPDSRGPLGDSLTFSDLATAEAPAQALGGTIGLVGMVILAVHATAIASDYSTGAIRNLLVRQASRPRLLAGKALALAAVTLVAVGAILATTVLTARLFVPSDIDTSQWFTTEGVAALARSTGNLTLAALGWGLLGQVLAVLSRSAVVSLAVGVGLAIPIDMTISNAVDGAEPWLPGRILQALASGGTQDIAYDRALTTALIAAALATIGSMVIFRHRDVTA